MYSLKTVHYDITTLFIYTQDSGLSRGSVSILMPAIKGLRVHVQCINFYAQQGSVISCVLFGYDFPGLIIFAMEKCTMQRSFFALKTNTYEKRSRMNLCCNTMSIQNIKDGM